MRMIDSHIHVGEYGRHYDPAFAATMMASVGRPAEAITTDIPALLAEMDAAGVAMAVILAFDAQRTLGTRVPDGYVAALCRAHPDRFIGLCSVDGRNPEAPHEVYHALTTLRLRGVKTAPAYLQLAPDDPCWWPVYEVAQARRAPVLVHTGFTPADGATQVHCIPRLLDRVAHDFPQLPLVAAHLGAPWVAQCLQMMERRPNLYADISIFGWYQPIEIVARVLSQARARGLLGRLLWGSDYPWGPVALFSQRMRRLRDEPALWPDQRPLDDEDYAAIMGGTAARLFLDGAAWPGTAGSGDIRDEYWMSADA